MEQNEDYRIALSTLNELTEQQQLLVANESALIKVLKYLVLFFMLIDSFKVTCYNAKRN
jgi:hypothetical protein